MKIAFVYNLKRDKSLEQAEFDTPETVEAIRKALQSAGHAVQEIEMPSADRLSEWMRALSDAKPDIVFNTAEGYFGLGRESLGPTFFEQLQLPYVGSGPYGCFLTLDKFLTKQMVASRGVPVIEGYFVNSAEDLQTVASDVVYPVFVKPNYEGSSKGITARSVCRDSDSFLQYASECLKQFPLGILVERFVLGRDVAVPYIAGLGESGVLEPLEYVLSQKQGFGDNVYDYELKNFNDDAVSVRCPADIEKSTRTQLVEMMKRIVPVTGAVDFARADFRVTPEGEVYFLELNALPSLQPGAGVFEATKVLGLDYDQTILKILEAATTRLKRQGKNLKSPRRIISSKTPKVALVYNLKRKSPGDSEYEREAEFDSQSTVDAIAAVLQKRLGRVLCIEANKSLAENLKAADVEVVFNIAEGSNKRAREAQVPAICDLLGIEHTASDATCLAITLDKAITKKLLSQDGVLTPAYRLYQGGKGVEPGLKFPVIVKPNHEGTSKGIGGKSVVTTQAELEQVAMELWKGYREPVLCEEYIEGREFTIGVLGNSTLRIMGPMEIVFKKDAGHYPVYSFEAKNLPIDTNPVFQLECPVSLGKEMDRKIAAFARKVYRSLGIRDVARIDFKIDSKGGIYFLEINPLPGLTPGFSDLVVMAEKSGMDFEILINRILTPALQRWRNAGKLRPA
jgi:D-alanine-D-alanine ligase